MSAIWRSRSSISWTDAVDRVGLAGQRCEALDPLGVGDLDVPALGLERVVDEPGAGHRLDDRVDVLAANLADSPRERSERVDIRATTSWSTCSPCSGSTQTSTLRRLRSNPTCNI
jgi:hypothetical protein